MAKVQRSYADLQSEIARLTKEADALRLQERKEVIDRVREAVSSYQLTVAELGLGKGPVHVLNGAKKPTASKRLKGIKFRDGQGNTWIGRGARPGWLRDALAAGKQLQDFAV